MPEEYRQIIEDVIRIALNACDSCSKLYDMIEEIDDMLYNKNGDALDTYDNEYFDNVMYDLLKINERRLAE